MDYLLGFISLACVAVLMQVNAEPNLDDPRELAEALANIGWMDNGDDRVENLQDPQAISDALMDYQIFFGLPATGNMNDETRKLMLTDRCGNRDPTGMQNSKRKKRYMTGYDKWKDSHLKYRIDNYTPDLSTNEVDRVIKDAFKVWSDVSSLTFEQVPPGSAADIIIIFRSGAHGPSNDPPFDGPRGTLAHAFYPSSGIGGDAHFDEAETWTIETNSGTNLFQVAAHEFGHSLGIAHSNIRGALMYPYYAGYVPDFKLHDDDIMAVQSLYGVGEAPTSTSTTPSPPNVNPSGGGCTLTDGKIDAIFSTDGDETYAFRGEYYFKISPSGNAAEVGKIQDRWSQLPSGIEAAFSWPSSLQQYWTYDYDLRRWVKKEVTAFGETFFFKGDKVYEYKKNNFVKVHNLNERFPGLPENLDSIFVWSGNHRVYATKGSLYYRIKYRTVYTDTFPVDNGYPRPLAIWTRNVQSNVDHFSAAFWYTVTDKTYFFVDDEYYRFNDRYFAIDEPEDEPKFPRKIDQWWYKCVNNVQMTDVKTEMEEDQGHQFNLVETVHSQETSSASSLTTVLSTMSVCLVLSRSMIQG